MTDADDDDTENAATQTSDDTASVPASSSDRSARTRQYAANIRIAKPQAKAAARAAGKARTWRAYIDRYGNFTSVPRAPAEHDGRVGAVLDEAVRIGLARRAGITPLEFLLSCLRDPDLRFAFKLDAAKAAAPYMHKRMPIAVEVSQGSQGISLDAAALHRLSRQELISLRSLLLKAGVGEPTFSGPDPGRYGAYSPRMGDGTSTSGSIRTLEHSDPEQEHSSPPANYDPPPLHPLLRNPTELLEHNQDSGPESSENQNGNSSQHPPLEDDENVQAAYEQGHIASLDPLPHLSAASAVPSQEEYRTPMDRRLSKNKRMQPKTLAEALLPDDADVVPFARTGNPNLKHAPKGKRMTKSQADQMLNRFEEKRRAREAAEQIRAERSSAHAGRRQRRRKSEDAA